LKWTALSVSTFFVVNIKSYGEWRVCIPCKCWVTEITQSCFRTMEIIRFLKWSYRKKPFWCLENIRWFAKLITLPLGLNLYTRKISLHRRAVVVHSFRMISPHNLHATGLSRHLCIAFINTALFKDACVQIVKKMAWNQFTKGELKILLQVSLSFIESKSVPALFTCLDYRRIDIWWVLYRLKRKSTKNFRSKLRRRFQRPSTSRKIQGHIKSERFY
jgi:hypothetical protein